MLLIQSAREGVKLRDLADFKFEHPLRSLINQAKFKLL
jgi:hypothetical protein